MYFLFSLVNSWNRSNNQMRAGLVCLAWLCCVGVWIPVLFANDEVVSEEFLLRPLSADAFLVHWQVTFHRSLTDSQEGTQNFFGLIQTKQT